MKKKNAWYKILSRSIKTIHSNTLSLSRSLSLPLLFSSLWEGLEWPHVGRRRFAVAPGRRAGAVAHGNSIAGGREAVWFIPQLQQMAATEVCLSSLHSRAGCQDRVSHTQEEEEGAGSWTHARRMFSDSGCLTTPLTPFQPHTHTHTLNHTFLRPAHFSQILQHMYLPQNWYRHTIPHIFHWFPFFALFISVCFHPVASTFRSNNCDTHTSSTLIRSWRCLRCLPKWETAEWNHMAVFLFCSSFKVIIHREKYLIYSDLTMQLLILLLKSKLLCAFFSLLIVTYL